MKIASVTKKFLERHHVAFELIDIPVGKSVPAVAAAMGLPQRMFVQAELMNDRYGLVMVVIPADRRVHHETLSQRLGRYLEPVKRESLAAVFRDIDAHCVPPFGEMYGVRTILDDSLIDNRMLLIPSGDPKTLIRLDARDFFRVLSNAWVTSDFTLPADAADEVHAGDAVPDGSGDGTFRDRLRRVDSLPPLPEMAQAILRLSADPCATAKDLARVVEQDPSLTAQILRYASSPFFSYRGKLDSVEVAISRVLGYDMVMNLALGLATAKPFRVPRQGPIGLDAIALHATYSAALAQGLSVAVPADRRLVPGMSYLAGLLHNFGLLLLGHVFREEYDRLNEEIMAHPEEPLFDVERRLFGMHHGELGAWLFEIWGMQEELIVAAREHHHHAYDGPFAPYAWCLMLADCLLKGAGIGDAPVEEAPPELFAALGITPSQAEAVFERIMRGRISIEQMAQQLAA